MNLTLLHVVESRSSDIKPKTVYRELDPAPTARFSLQDSTRYPIVAAVAIPIAVLYQYRFFEVRFELFLR